MSVRPGRVRRALSSRVLAGGAAMVALIGVAACSGSKPSPSPSPSATTSAPTGTATSTGSPGPAVAQPIGALLNQNLMSESLSALPALSGGDSFYELVWCDVVKQPGVYNWRRADQMVQQAQQAGINTFIKLRTGACWATSGSAKFSRGVGKTESAMPQSMSMYQSFVRQAVARYKAMGVTEYAIENETNSPSFWDGTPQQYDQLARAVASAVHDADPSAVVVDSSVSSVAVGYGVVQQLLHQGRDQQALDYYNAYYARRFGTRGALIQPATNISQLQAMMRTPTVARNLAFLAEANTLVADHVVQARQVHFYEPPAVLAQLLAFLKAHTPKDIPLQIWELGSFLQNSTLTPQQRADEVVQDTTTALAAGVTKILWLPLIARENGRITSNQLFALLDTNGQPTPAFTAYSAIAAAARGAKITPVTSGGLQGVGFDKAGTTTLFVTAPNSPVTVPVAANAKVAAIDGSAAPQTSGGSVTVGTTPVQLTMHGTAAKFLASLS